MKNRILSLLLATVIMAGLVVLPAAAVINSVAVTVNRQTATIGDTLVYTLNVDPATNVQTRVRITANGVVVYNGGYTDGKTHSYKIRLPGEHVAEAIAIDKTDATLSTFSVPTKVSKLPAPTGLKVTPNTATSLKISWNPVAGVDGYFVLASAGKWGPYTVKRTVAGTSVIDTYLKTGTMIFYKVVGYNKVNTVRQEVTERSSGYKIGVPLGTTSIVSITSPLAGRVTLKWSKAAGATSYAVYRSTSLNGTYSLVNTTTALSYTNTNLLRGRIYYYKVMPRLKLSGVTFSGPLSAARYVRVK